MFYILGKAIACAFWGACNASAKISISATGHYYSRLIRERTTKSTSTKSLEAEMDKKSKVLLYQSIQSSNSPFCPIMCEVEHFGISSATELYVAVDTAYY